MIGPYEIFLNIFNMSITASWLVLAIIVIRLVFKKAPKALFVALWALVGIRLICPFSIESVLSLVPNTETVPLEFHSLEGTQLHENTVINIISNPNYQAPVTYELEQSVDRTQLAFISGFFVWLIGMAAMLIYTLISYLKIHKKVSEAIPHKDNIMLCDRIDTPFILGLFKPKIYIPSAMNESDMQYVIAHEKAHLKRRDHLWKPLGFLLLTVYWFNPVLWVAYILLCRDIELACDEKVIKEMGVDIKKAYSQALINCSVKHKSIAACPLAFGETGVKARIKSVLNYKKPAFWIIALALVASIVVGICFLTDPVSQNNVIINQESGSNMDGLSVEIVSSNFEQPSPYIEIKWKNRTKNVFTYGEEFYIYKQVDGEWVDCRTVENYAWNLIGYTLKPHSVLTTSYSLNYISMDAPGLYRFESSCNLDSPENKEFGVWIEFEVSEGMQEPVLQLLTPVDMMYSDGSYSSVQTVDAAPSYLLGSNMSLKEMTKDSLVTELGVMEETELDSESFDSRFRWDKDSWTDGYNLNEIKKNNYRMWELYLGNGEERFFELYILLQQKDGSFILGYGYYNCQSENPQNPDDSHIRWLYKMSADASLDNIELSQVATDGTILFYDGAVDEDQYPKSYASYIQLNGEELQKLLVMLEEQKWISDALVDRVSFNFNGQLRYDNKWIYFGYEQKVIYCNEYFCEVSDEIIDCIKSFNNNAVEFDPIELNSKIYVYHNSPDLVNPNIVLNEQNNTFQFTYSGYSSYIARGEYEYINNKLILKTDDYNNTYVFEVDKDNNTLTFLAEKSSRIPEYKYSGSSTETYSPVPGGAIFTADGTAGQIPYYTPLYGTRTFDIDGDGKDETCVLSIGSSMEYFTFSITAWENGNTSATPEYYNTFHIGSTFELQFTDENGKVQVKAVSLGEDTETYYYDIEVDDNGWIALTFGNGRKLVGYHGEQGVEGYLQSTKNYSAALYNSTAAFANYYSGDEFYSSSLNSLKMLINSVQHLPVHKFETLDELKQFKAKYKDNFTFDQGWDEVPSFDDATEHMDKEFFDKYTLFLTYVSAESTSYRFGVNSVYNDGENLCIHVEQTNSPNAADTMMAGWFILVPIEKEQVQSCTAFDADLNNIPE